MATSSRFVAISTEVVSILIYHLNAQYAIKSSYGLPGRGPQAAAIALTSWHIDLRLRASTTVPPPRSTDSGGPDISRSLRESPEKSGAEGATAPETLRQKDRRGMRLWKAGAARRASPTE